MCVVCKASYSRKKSCIASRNIISTFHPDETLPQSICGWLSPPTTCPKCAASLISLHAIVELKQHREMSGLAAQLSAAKTNSHGVSRSKSAPVSPAKRSRLVFCITGEKSCTVEFLPIRLQPGMQLQLGLPEVFKSSRT